MDNQKILSFKKKKKTLFWAGTVRVVKFGFICGVSEIGGGVCGCFYFQVTWAHGNCSFLVLNLKPLWALCLPSLSLLFCILSFLCVPQIHLQLWKLHLYVWSIFHNTIFDLINMFLIDNKLLQYLVFPMYKKESLH